MRGRDSGYISYIIGIVLCGCILGFLLLIGVINFFAESDQSGDVFPSKVVYHRSCEVDGMEYSRPHDACINADGILYSTVIQRVILVKEL